MANPDYVKVATDMRNALDTIHRTAVLKAVAERLPQFAFVNWAYSVPAELWVHGGPNGHERLWCTDLLAGAARWLGCAPHVL